MALALPGRAGRYADGVEPGQAAARILAICWGRTEVESLGAGKDFKLYPGGGRARDWAETRTRHSPGIQPGDIAERVDRRATTVVLSRGMNRRLQDPPATRRYLEQRSVMVHVAETREAVKIYNDLAETEPAAGLFHSTC